jgi:hypothetical protein
MKYTIKLMVIKLNCRSVGNNLNLKLKVIFNRKLIFNTA